MENESQTKGLENLGEKKERLLRILAGMDRALVAFSGGLDSSFLLAVAKEALGDKVVAATASSPIHPMRELEIARKFCMEQGIKHLVFESREMSIDRFLENPPDRCYWCKRAMLIQLKEMAEREGLGPILHGLNKDELRDYRPGNRASQELGIRAPLLEAGLGKREVRAISKSMGLSVWNKPPSGCLATRVPYGQRITREKLAMVEQAEEFLLALGFEEVRVRHHGEMARVEVGQEAIYRLLTPGLREDLVAHFRGLGFLYVALDIEGFVSGKMNRSLVKEDKEIEKK